MMILRSKQLVNRVRADMWTIKALQAPKQLPQSKKVINIVPVTGIPRTFLVQTERDPPMWKWLSVEESSSGSAASKAAPMIVPVEIFSILLPGLSDMHTRFGAVTSVVVHTIDPTAREAGVILSALTIGTLHGYVASFYYRSWGGASAKDGHWILTAIYKHVDRDNPQTALGVRPMESNVGIVGLWVTDELIMSASENHQFSFWNRINAGDTLQLAAAIPKAKNILTPGQDNLVQLQMAKAKNEFCRHSARWVEPNVHFRGEIPETLETCDRVCTLIRSNKLKPEAGRPIVSVTPSTPGCASQVVFALGGAISIWAFHAANGKHDESFSATVQLTPKQILAAVGSRISESFTILQARLLDDYKSTIRTGLGYRDRLVTLLQFGPKQAKTPQPVVLALWQLEYVPTAVVPRLLTASLLGHVSTPEQLSFDVGPSAHIYSFFKSTVVMVAFPEKMVLVGLSNGQIIDVWSWRSASEPAGSSLANAKSRITAITCREDLGVVITAFSDLSMRFWSAETGGLPIRSVDMSFASSAASPWISSTRMSFRAISPGDPYFFAALDPHCIYLRQMKKY
jgi:hypothetical protein